MDNQDDRTTEDRFASNTLFTPDTLLPSQYFDRLRSRTEYDGERRLMLAILEDAVDVYRKQAGARDRKRQRHFLDAEAWIEDTDASWIFSFENICVALGLDPEYLRGGLRAWKREAGGGPTGQVVVLHSRPVAAAAARISSDERSRNDRQAS
jgi:hypothetical protein